jgi:hypothetical protein
MDVATFMDGCLVPESRGSAKRLHCCPNRDALYWRSGPIAATIALEMIGPMPGTVISRSQRSHRRGVKVLCYRLRPKNGTLALFHSDVRVFEKVPRFGIEQTAILDLVYN